MIMDKKCNFCGNKNFSIKKVQYILRRDKHVFIMDGVPCEECDFCGEQFFSAVDLKKIESRFNKVVSGERRPMKRIMVPIEKYAV
jgi:YgiT-type zinc finger domain-containing protein